MKNYVVSFEDGRVEKIAAQGLLETSYCYILFREYRRDQAWEQDIVAVFAKSELLERPHPIDEGLEPQIDQRAA